jgi:hypothetical protein
MGFPAVAMFVGPSRDGVAWGRKDAVGAVPQFQMLRGHPVLASVGDTSDRADRHRRTFRCVHSPLGSAEFLAGRRRHGYNVRGIFI